MGSYSSCSQLHSQCLGQSQIHSPTRSSGPPKRRRQERTVYTKEQLDVLKEYFQKNEYPGYQDRLHLATRLSLEEHKLQVWFKNRRAQRSRLQRLAKGRSQSARAAPSDPGTPGAPGPAPAPVAAAAAAVAGPAFPDGPGFRRPPPRSPAGTLPAPEPRASSRGRAAWAPAQGARAPVQAAPAPAPAPAWPLDPFAPSYGPDPFPIPDFTVVFSPHAPSPGCPSPLMSGSPKRDESVDENDLDPKRLLSL
ncbi:tetrapeptide repeat homeobox protein 2-like [Physeter macrocephalus]|uniref:Tetrapeptide repeat homeobox protein 2-like n=1 Tax=Physeter macrocephalus TaxID=9755 RepID=A0A9W2W7V7_PHYMC|nr:tetrapeptide repeat homeobox protein 2-like [Physeter catodon]